MAVDLHRHPQKAGEGGGPEPGVKHVVQDGGVEPARHTAAAGHQGELPSLDNVLDDMGDNPEETGGYHQCVDAVPRRLRWQLLEIGLPTEVDPEGGFGQGVVLAKVHLERRRGLPHQDPLGHVDHGVAEGCRGGGYQEGSVGQGREVTACMGVRMAQIVCTHAAQVRDNQVP